MISRSKFEAPQSHYLKPVADVLDFDVVLVVAFFQWMTVHGSSRKYGHM
jgi:hypothetical protein